MENPLEIEVGTEEHLMLFVEEDKGEEIAKLKKELETMSLMSRRREIEFQRLNKELQEYRKLFGGLYERLKAPSPY